MTHQNCIATLLAAPGGETGAPPSVARDEAQAHVAHCSDCWAVLSLMHELATGTSPAGAERMPELFGCAPVRDDLYLLAGLTAAEVRAAHPAHARHLGWCHACRDRLAEIMVVERAAARGEFGPALVALPEARWREGAARAGQRVHEAVGRVVVHVRRAAAAFAAVPEGFAVTMVAAPAGAYRGDAAPDATPGQQLVRFALPDSTLAAEVTLEPRHDERVGVAVRFSGGDPRRLSVHLHEVQGERTALVARHAVRGADPVVFRALGAGHYLLEIREREQARRIQVRFDVETPA